MPSSCKSEKLVCRWPCERRAVNDLSKLVDWGYLVAKWPVHREVFVVNREVIYGCWPCVIQNWFANAVWLTMAWKTGKVWGGLALWSEKGQGNDERLVWVYSVMMTNIWHIVFGAMSDLAVTGWHLIHTVTQNIFLWLIEPHWELV